MTRVQYLESLNPQQRQAVEAGPGAVLVLAGPGSGKTRVLTHRAAYLMIHGQVDPYHLIAMTFTNKAAREMYHRVTKLVLVEPRRMWLGTFHAICARLLRIEAARGVLPFTQEYVIFDDDDQEKLVKASLLALNIDTKLYRPTAIRAAISRAKNEMLSASQLPVKNTRDQVLQKAYQRYQDLLLQNNGLDFDDLLLYAADLLEQNQEVRQRYASRFQQVLVDEFQDTNMVQYRLLKSLCGQHGNIFVVGDEDQSIYRWRGADYRNVLRFEEDFSGCRKILLEQNYRSTQIILDGARAVIDRNPHRTMKRLVTSRGMGERIRLINAQDDQEEAAVVIRLVNELTRPGKIGRQGIAVMYRTNAQSRVLEEAFLTAGIPHKVVGAQRFYGRREVKDIIAYLRLVHNPADTISLERAINVPPRQIGEKTFSQLMEYAGSINAPPAAVLMDLPRKEASPHWSHFPGKAFRLADFGSRLQEWDDLKARLSLSDLLNRILVDINYRDYLEVETEEGAERWENIEELQRMAAASEDQDLPSFLERIALVSDQDTLTDSADAVTLLTLHASKGLEFDAVFITGLDEKWLPHNRSYDDEEQMYEERRLFYVGMTRAKDRLFLLRAERRQGFGGYDYTEASRFLLDIPEMLIERQGQQPRRDRYSWDQSSYAPAWNDRSVSSSTAWNSPSRIEPQPELRYQSMMRVTHPSYGEGTVLESRIDDGDEVVDVQFKSVGFKRLIASLAGLVIVENRE